MDKNIEHKGDYEGNISESMCEEISEALISERLRESYSSSVIFTDTYSIGKGGIQLEGCGSYLGKDGEVLFNFSIESGIERGTILEASPPNDLLGLPDSSYLCASMESVIRDNIREGE